MKILIIHNRYKFKGGEDTVFEAECKMLEANGHRVVPVIFENNQIKGLRKVLLFFDFFFSISSYLKIIQIIKKEKPDIVHIHNLFFVASQSVIYAARFCKVPIVLTLHNYRILCPSAVLFHNNKLFESSLKEYFPISAVRNKVFRNSRFQTIMLAINITIHKSIGTWNLIDKYVVLTQFSKRVFKKSSLKIDEKKFVVKPNFVEDNGYSYEKEDFYFFAGRLSEEKGIIFLINAFTKINKRLVIAGSGPLEEEIKKKCLGLENVDFVGVKNHSEVIELLKKSKALIFSSIWHETFGMIVVEAFSCGTPVIASKMGSMNELIQEKVNGLWFEAGIPESLISTVERFENNPDHQMEMRIGARNSYEKKYSEEINYIKILNVYENLIKRNDMIISRRPVNEKNVFE